MIFRLDTDVGSSFRRYIVAKENLENASELFNQAFTINSKHPSKNNFDEIIDSLHRLTKCYPNYIAFNDYGDIPMELVEKRLRDFGRGEASYKQLCIYIDPIKTAFELLIGKMKKEVFDAEGEFAADFDVAYNHYIATHTRHYGVPFAEIMKTETVKQFFFKFLTA